MRAAVLSDIHANMHALQAVAKDIIERSVDEIWCLGDVVGYGAHPRETLQWVLEHADITVKGNHDEAVATGEVHWFNPMAAQAARAHAQRLTPPERNTLYGWPPSLVRAIAPGRPVPPDAAAAPAARIAPAGPAAHVAPASGAARPAAARTRAGGDAQAGGVEVLLAHASPDDPLHEYVQPQDARLGLRRWEGRARVILLGHTHRPFAAMLLPREARDAAGAPDAAAAGAWSASGFAETLVDERRDARPLLLVNPGSVGQPRDGDPRASYAILDFAARTVELRRVAYDVEAAAQAIVKEGLDQILALRLYEGR